MTDPRTVLALLAEHARGLILTRFRRDSCIVSTRIALDVCAAHGLTARPELVECFLYTPALFERVKRGTFAKPFRPGEWSVGLGVEGARTIDRVRGLDGHLVLLLPIDGTEYLLDLSLDQADRPERGLHVRRPFLSAMPADWREGLSAVHFDGAIIVYRPRTGLRDDYTRSKDWHDFTRRARIVEAVHHRIDADLQRINPTSASA